MLAKPLPKQVSHYKKIEKHATVAEMHNVSAQVFDEKDPRRARFVGKQKEVNINQQTSLMKFRTLVMFNLTAMFIVIIMSQ